MGLHCCKGGTVVRMFQFHHNLLEVGRTGERNSSIPEKCQFLASMAYPATQKSRDCIPYIQLAAVLGLYGAWTVFSEVLGLLVPYHGLTVILRNTVFRN